MKQLVVGFLKVAVPLGIGLYLVHYFYSGLSEAQRAELFEAFRRADPFWLVVATVVGWLGHVLRAWRWEVLLEPLGYRTRFWDRYNAVMSGYFMNLFIPRAGEASRAVALQRSQGVPFAQGFGTIMAERVVDTLLLLAIAGITVLLQFERIDLFKERIAAFRADQGPAAEEGFPWMWVIAAVLVVAGVAAGSMAYRSEAVRARIRTAGAGFFDGLRTVFKARRKGAFILGSFAIWGSYLLMFQLGLYCLPTTAEVPLAGVLAGFVAGAIGIVLVQGGIGVYPAFVGLILTIYMGLPAEGMVQPDALAIGWLLWLVQTLMIVVLGGLSLLLTTFSKRDR